MTNSSAQPVPLEARRILNLIAAANPHLNIEPNFVESNVHFVGDDLPLQPGPLKSGACVSALQAAFGAVADQIAQIRFG